MLECPLYKRCKKRVRARLGKDKRLRLRLYAYSIYLRYLCFLIPWANASNEMFAQTHTHRHRYTRTQLSNRMRDDAERDLSAMSAVC